MVRNNLASLILKILHFSFDKVEIVKSIILIVLTIWLMIEGNYILNGDDKGLIDWILRKLGF